jgi:hypothetical protein
MVINWVKQIDKSCILTKNKKGWKKYAIDKLSEELFECSKHKYISLSPSLSTHSLINSLMKTFAMFDVSDHTEKCL